MTLPLAGIGSRSIAPKSQVESCEHQDDANVHHQPFPEMVSEERDIRSDYNDCHHHNIKRDSHLSDHSGNSTTASETTGVTSVTILTCPGQSGQGGSGRDA
jgi:hypothetical protein